jgi:oligopeptide/dipeptide ABC transporter ATP-binding protein
MYAGKVIEYATVGNIFAVPLHPYTQGLLSSIPRLGRRLARLQVIPGVVPNAFDFPSGCRFHPRCPLADERCRVEEPPLKAHAEGHLAACWHAGEVAFALPAEQA